MPAPLFGPNWLQEAVEKVINAVEAGKLKLPEGQERLTPTVVAKFIQKAKKMETPPSTGAVNAVFKRWEDYGIVVMHQDRPYAFKAWGPNKDKGVAGVKAERVEARRAEREANKPPKPAKAPAKKAASTKAKAAPAKGAAKKAPAKKAAPKATAAAEG